MSEAAARLEVLTGKAAGTSIVVDDELIIGRQAEGVGRLADDEEISRSHARLSVDTSGSWTIEDLGSTNGTFVNGMRIAAPETLAEGDTVEVGGTTLVVRELSGRETDPEPAPQTQRPQATVTHDSPIFAPGGVPAEDEQAEPPNAGQPAFDDMAAATEAMPSESEALPTAASTPEVELAPPAAEAPSEAAPVAESPRPGGEVDVPTRASLRLEIDFAGRALEISFDGDSEPIRLVFADDTWQPSAPSTEKGTTP